MKFVEIQIKQHWSSYIHGWLINWEIIHVFIQSNFFMLSNVKSSKTLPIHSWYAFISESFVLNWLIFIPLANKKTIGPVVMQTQTEFLSCFSEIHRIFSCCCYSSIIVLSSLCVGFLPGKKDVFLSFISMHRRTIINCKYYYILAKCTTTQQRKSWIYIKSNTIFRIKKLENFDG